METKIIKRYSTKVNHDRVIKKLMEKITFTVIFTGKQQEDFILNNRESINIQGDYLIFNCYDDSKNNQFVMRLIYDNNVKIIYSDQTRLIAEYYIKFFSLGFEYSYFLK